MLYFWFGLMIVFSAAYLLWFFLKPLKSHDLDLAKSNIELGKQKQAELDRELAAGLISDDEIKAAKAQIAEVLAGELTQTTKKSPDQTPSLGLIIFVLILLPLGSFPLYSALTPEPPKVQAPLSLKDGVEKIRYHLLQNPNDLKAWRMLGRTLSELDKTAEAIKAYDQAVQIAPNNSTLLTEFAAILITQADEGLINRGIEMLKQAIKINPKSSDALYLIGYIAANAGDFELAKISWQRSLSFLPANHPDQKIIEDALSRLAELSASEQESAQKPDPQIEQKLEQEIEPKSEPQIEQHFITVNVEIAEQISQSRADDFVLIYAIAASGRPMPIVIQKLQLRNFTGQIVLDDQSAILPQRTLSNAGKVVVKARISSSGSAQKQVGDLEVVSQILSVKTNPSINLIME